MTRVNVSGSFIAPALVRRPAAEGLPAGPWLPELIQSAQYGLDPYGFFFRAHRRFGDAYTVRVLGQTWVVVAHPDSVRELFQLGPEDVNSGETNVDLRPILGTGNVGLLDGDEHLQRRRIVLPSLQRERMPAYAEMVGEVAGRRIAELPVDTPVSVLPRMRRITFDVLLRGVLGAEDRAAVDRIDAELESLLAYSMNPVRGAVFALLGPEGLARMPGFRRRHAALDEDVFGEIRRRRDDPRLGEREDLLSRLLRIRDERGVALPDEELRDEIVTLLVAGQETTASLLSWAVHELARAPEAQERLAAGEEGWAEAVIRETLRLHPPIVIILRRLRHELRVAGHDLPTGTTIAIAALLVHRRPDLYPEPDAFRPERFLGKRTTPGDWMPFGGGARRCLGAPLAQLEARMVLEQLAREHTIRPARARRERAGRRGIVTVPGRGGRVVLSRRSA
ncbi:MAG TPA: cytochrome P450 [Thermoleophilaceae bacterium]